MKKLVSVLCILLAAMLLIAGCGGGTSSSPSPGNGSAQPSAEAGRTDIVVALPGEPPILFGGFSPETPTGMVSRQIFDNLIAYKDDGTYAPQLATAWEFTPDGKDIIFTLREGVYFHNGELMTAEDVVFSYNTIIDSKISDSMTSAMDHMEKIDDTHVKLVFKMVYGPALKPISHFNLPIYSKSAFESDPSGFERNPVGSGPYKFSEWKSGDSLTLVAHDKYWDGAPAIPTLIFKFFEDDSTASLALQNGEIDVLTTPPTTDKDRLQSNPNLQFKRTMGVNTYWIHFSFREDRIFSNEDLRLAVAYAIDKEAVLLGAMNGEGSIVETIFPTFIENVDLSYKAPTNDPEKAKEHLALAGYPDGIEFTVVTTSRAMRYRPLEIIQGQLAAVGIIMNLEKIEGSSWWSDIHDGKNFVMNSIDNDMFMPDIDDTYSLFRGGQWLNNYDLDDPELNELYDLQRYTSDPEVRRQACYDLVRVMGDRAINIPLFEWYNDIVADVNLKGIEARQMGTAYRVNDWSW